MTTEKLIADARMWVDFFDPRSIVDSDILTKLCDTIERQQKEIDALRGFAREIVDIKSEYPSVHTNVLIIKGLEHGILEHCAEKSNGMPYRHSPLLTGEPHDQ